MIPVMLRIMLSAAALLAATPAQAAERRFTVTGFERVQVEGPFAVTLAVGKAPGAVATGSTAALDRLSITVEGRTLRIRPNRSAWGAPPAPGEGGVAIALSTHELSAAIVNGSASLQIDRAKAMRFDLSLSGSGRIALNEVQVDRLNLQLLGAGGIAVGGSAKQLRATVTGQGNLDGAKLVADDADLTADTSGAISFAARRSAKVAASGAGDVTITGTPACTLSGFGAGRVRCGVR
jgi:hypothetical protein